MSNKSAVSCRTFVLGKGTNSNESYLLTRVDQ